MHHANLFDDVEGSLALRSCDWTVDPLEWVPSPAVAPTLAPQQQPVAATPPAAVFSNNKRALDVRWDHLLSLSSTELRAYKAAHAELSAQDRRDIDAARRRAKNRGYSRKSSQRKKAGAGMAEVVRERDALMLELERSYAREAQLLAVLKQHGIPAPPPPAPM